MKNIFLTLAFCGLTMIAKSQNASVEQSIFGIQTGFLGVWVHNEFKLSNQIALRSEIGLDSGFTFNERSRTDFFLAPAITLEPRWYYNLNKRESKSKRIDGNSGNFLALKTTYHPDLFTLFNKEDLNLLSDISIIPTWGIRRNIGKHFHYEAGLGIGYRIYFTPDDEFYEGLNGFTENIHLRIGYRF